MMWYIQKVAKWQDMYMEDVINQIKEVDQAGQADFWNLLLNILRGINSLKALSYTFYLILLDKLTNC